MRPRASTISWKGAGRPLLPFRSGTRASARRSRRVRLVFGAAVLAAAVFLATTGCIRLDLNIIVRDSGDGEFNGRFTVAPLLVDMLGGVEGLEASVREEFADDDYEVEIQRVRDSDDWQGIAVKAFVPADEVVAGVGADSTIQETENGWRFSMRDANPFADAPSTVGFRFRFSVSLPGELESSNADSTEARGGMTTARWEITDPTAPVDFYLVTDTSRAAEGGGLGAGIAGIVGAAAVAGGLAWLWWLRRTSNTGRLADEPEENPATPDNAP